MLVLLGPDERWSLDFVFDQLTDCRRSRILAIMDDCMRECLTPLADTSLSRMRLARELDRLRLEGSAPELAPSRAQLGKPSAGYERTAR